MKFVMLQGDGKDYHGAGCSCGSCNENGHSYGCRIVELIPEYQELCLNSLDENKLVSDDVYNMVCDSDDALEEEALLIVYGCSETAAWDNACKYCKENDLVIL